MVSQHLPIAENNQLIDSAKELDERRFLLSVCDSYNKLELKRFYELRDLLNLFKKCIYHLKTIKESYNERFIFITNELDSQDFDKIQKFTFFWVFKKYLAQLDLSEIKFGRRIYLDLIDSELQKLEPIAMQYATYDFKKLVEPLSGKAPEEQIRLLIRTQKEYQIFIEEHNIRDNKFGSLCTKQIELIKLRRNQDDTEQPEVSLDDNNQALDLDSDHANTHESLVNPIKSMVEDFKIDNPDIIRTEMQKADSGDIDFAAEILGYSKSHIRKLCRDDKLPHSKPHGTYRFKRVDLLEWLDQGGSKRRQEMLELGKTRKKR